MKKRYYITGISGTGKSTITAELNKRGIFAVDQDEDLCVWRHNQTKEVVEFEYGIGTEFLESHDWYCDVDKLKEILKGPQDIIFVCGVTANQDEYLNLFDKVFLLRCPPQVFIQRINTRTDNDFGKHVSEREHLLAWQKELEAGLIEKGAIVINCEKPVSEVIEEILKRIEK